MLLPPYPAPSASQQRDDVQIPKTRRLSPAPTLAQIEKRAPDRNTAIIKAHATGAYSYQQFAEYFGFHVTTVGKIVRKGV